MRPLFLKIEGLKSVAEEQSVDFEKLSENGIFGIFGNTGSGKSTVLDAIVLAVYGEVTENLKNEEFINMSCDRARVELAFSASVGGEKRFYKVERVYKFNKARTAVTSSASLWEKKDGEYYSVAENAATVTKKLKEEIIGLEKRDFLKCIALPQGEFSAFVKMTKGERLAVIGKLFDITKYGDELARKIKEKDNACQLEYQKLSGKSEALGCVSEEEIKNDGLTLESYKEELAKLNEQKTFAAEELEKAKKAREVKTELDEKNKKLAEKSAYKPVIEQKREKLKRFDELKPLANTLVLYEKTIAEKKVCAQKTLSAKKLSGELESKFLLAAKEKEKCDEINGRIIELNVKKAKTQTLSDFAEELAVKSKKIIQLRNDYLNEKRKCEAAEKRREENAKKAEELIKLANDCGANAALEKIKELSAKSAAYEQAADERGFLTELKEKLSPEISPESAVYGLIDRRIAYLINKFVGAESGELPAEIKKAASGLSKQAELFAESAKYSGEAAKAGQEDLSSREKMQKLTDEGKTLKAEYDEKDAKIKAELGGLSLKEALELIDQETKEKTAELKRINENYDKLSAEKQRAENLLVSLEAEMSGLEKTEASAIKILSEKLGCENKNSAEEAAEEIEKAKAVIFDANAEKDRASVSAFDDEVKILENRAGELNEKIASTEAEYFNYELFFEKNREKCDLFDEFKKKYDELSVKHKNDLKNFEERCIINHKIETVSHERDLLGRLTELVKAGKFMEFIAEEYLKEIADEAETRVLELTGGRYGLVYDGNFFVTDNFSGGARRPVAGLSGGETFIVSLSLALALSKQISAKALKPIDFFFLDEGFGTLDEDLIDAVADCLEKLQRANFTVGLITHVAELKNRISSKLLVHGATASRGTVIESSY